MAHLEHAFVYVKDLDETLAFYRNLLPDWTVRWEGTSSAGTRWLHFGPPTGGQPGYLSLCERPDGVPFPDDDRTLSINHIGFAHPDVRALESRLADAGLRPTDRIDDGKYRRAYFRDPSGHEIEIVQKL